MLIISPRSYVTAAFGQLFPALLEHVYDVLSPMSNWWANMVLTNKAKLFSDEIQKKISENDVPDNYAVLFDYFDEHSICILVLDYAKRHFSDGDLNLFKKLLTIRNEWAHRNYRESYWQAAVYDDEASKRKWAISSLIELREVAKELNVQDISEDISILLFKMKCDWIGLDDDVDLPPHKVLLDWLYENVVEKVIDDSSPVCDEVKLRINNSFNSLIEVVSGSSNSASKSLYIIDYYWNAIKSKTDVYKEIKRHDGIPTFEGVVEKFTEVCYGNQL